MNAVLELERVEHAYRRTVALRGVTMRMDPGEVLAVTGPSGCGKSTLLHCAAGILRPRDGRIHLIGNDLGTMSEAQRSRLRRRHVGVVLQHGHLVPDLPLVENVALPLLLDGRAAGEARRAARDWLERTGVVEEAQATPAELSGGQAQRAAVARALVTDPAVVFADEPTGSLDSTGGAELLDLLLSAARERGTALMLVTHDNLVASRADREIRLLDGRVRHEVNLR